MQNGCSINRERRTLPPHSPRPRSGRRCRPKQLVSPWRVCFAAPSGLGRQHRRERRPHDGIRHTRFPGHLSGNYSVSPIQPADSAAAPPSSKPPSASRPVRRPRPIPNKGSGKSHEVGIHSLVDLLKSRPRTVSAPSKTATPFCTTGWVVRVTLMTAAGVTRAADRESVYTLPNKDGHS